MTPPAYAAATSRNVCCCKLKRKIQDDPGVQTAYQILENYFDEFTKKHYEKIQKGLNLTDEGLKEAINQIIRLTPKPGGNYSTVSKAEKLCSAGLFYI